MYALPMTLWLIFALMTAAAILAVLWPLSRPVRLQAGSGVAVYRDQLDEIERDRAAGLIAGAEAQAARTEVSRRLIAATEQSEARIDAGGALWWRRLVAVAALVIVPLVGLGVYLKHGSPQLPGEPLAQRQRSVQDNAPLTALIAQAEAHLERQPNDGRGWEVLAPVYLRLGQFDDAVKARRNALRLNGETADRQSDLGEALVAAANGIVTADARQSFERALALDAQDLKSRFYMGLAAEQDGLPRKAGEIWQAMLKEAPADAPWASSVREALVRLGEKPADPGRSPTADDVAATNAMTDAERAEMVQGMVSRLADRLQHDGSDVEGWLRLVRAYVVLGERDKANAAAADARRALATEPDKQRRVDELAKGLGLDG
jgi:cytochrome c-type biogenesis protein CcmH